MNAVLLVAAFLAGTASGQEPETPQRATQAQGPQVQTSGYVPHRVYDTAARAFVDFESMVAALARTDVVFVGEQHDDPNTHRLELAILEGLLRRKRAVTVSLEMFERDVQPHLDRYLASTSAEAEFLHASRPWPRYETDYRPLVEFAKRNGWPIIAANVPRRHASAVAKEGLGAIEALTAAERTQAASAFECPRDAYFERFAAAMAEHPPPDAAKKSPEENRARVERYYDSQCLKDETMAESIARAAAEGAAVVHFNGAFHSDFGHGAVERTRRRLPGRSIAIVTILPRGGLDGLVPAEEDRRRADYLIYALGEAPRK